MTIGSNRLFQVFKYAVYAFLAMNVYWFFIEEYAAAALQFADGVNLGNFREAYSSTVDTFAWVVLLLMFELETYVLEDRHFTRPVTVTLHGMRFLCYATITLMFFGYIDNLQFFNAAAILEGINSVCALPAEGWSWSIDIDEYEAITAANCATWTDSSTLYQFQGMKAVVDKTGLIEIIRLAWVDVINAGVWLLVVLVLEIDVRLQEHNRLEGFVLHASNAIKFVLYAILFIAAVYWGIKGDFVDFWDAFLWLVAFIFIELNVFEWRQEERAAASAVG
ncbi:MAG: hypothetical protein QNJ11_19530 [Woeseiaceae bacterium]|nr:hypothetical protein [Woeseiaceae bacterium]